MKTKIFARDAIQDIADTIRNGGLVAIPTDTVYGLAIRSTDSETYDHLKAVKGRPDEKPFPLMVSSFEMLETFVEMDAITRHLVKAFMPGAVTFVFNKKKTAFPFLGEQATLGIRMADDPWVHSVIDAVGGSIWLPSANLSGQPTGTSAEMVLSQLDGAIEGVVEGAVSGGISSSVFDLTDVHNIAMYRQGPIPLEAVIKTVQEYLEFDGKSGTITDKKERD